MFEENTDDIKLCITDRQDRAEGYVFQMDVLYPHVRAAIASAVTGGSGTDEAANMAKLIRTGVKGLLLMYGDKMLTIMLGKDHEKPGKKDDIVEWYTDMFARVVLTIASKRLFEIRVDGVDKHDNKKISGVSSFPLRAQHTEN